MDCTKMTDPELQAALRDVNAELDRRDAYRAIPGQVAAMTTQYIADGGKRDDVKAAVAGAPEPSSTTTPPPPPASGGGTGGTGGGSTSTGGTNTSGSLSVDVKVGGR